MLHDDHTTKHCKKCKKKKRKLNDRKREKLTGLERGDGSISDVDCSWARIHWRSGLWIAGGADVVSFVRFFGSLDSQKSVIFVGVLIELSGDLAEGQLNIGVSGDIASDAEWRIFWDRLLSWFDDWSDCWKGWG